MHVGKETTHSGHIISGKNAAPSLRHGNILELTANGAEG